MAEKITGKTGRSNIHHALQRGMLLVYSAVRSTGILETTPARRLFVWFYFLYKTHMEDNYAALVKKYPAIFSGGHIIDVGANVGYTAVLFSQVLTNGYSIFAFEPEQKNFDMLCDVVKRRALDARVVPIHAAVGAREGTVRLWYNPQHAGDHRVATDSFVGNQGGDERYQDIPMISLDMFSEKSMSNQPVSFIKIDVQGYESEVCAGMVNLLEKNPQAVVGAEYTPEAMRALGFNPHALADFFESRSYHPYVLGRHGLSYTTYDNIRQDLSENEYQDIIFSKKNLII